MLWSNTVFAKIVIPVHNWSSQVVMAYVIGGIFESMGYRVQYQPADSQKVYKDIGKGKVSISHEVWQSAFGRNFESEVSRGNVIDAGEHAAFTHEEMGFPNYVIEKNLCPGLPDWTALKNPDCARNFKRSGGKGVWLEGPHSWHGDLMSQRLAALGLSNLWKVEFAGNADALWAELARAKREGRGTIIFNWTPNFTDMEGFTMIEFPPYYSGCRPADGGSGKCGSPTGYLKKAAGRKFANNYPDAFRAFQKISFTTKDIGTMAGYVDVHKMRHEDAARQWLSENRHKWEYWTGRTSVVYNADEQQRIDRKGITKIVIPVHNWSSQIVMAYVIGGIFESMGYRVQYQPADSQKVYKAIGKGKVSISHEVWQSAFGKSFDNAISRGGVIDAGEHAAFTMEDMGVPNWVIEKNLCPGLPDWTALKNPDCARNFKQSGGKGVWLEGPQSWHQDLMPQRLAALGLSNLWKVEFAGNADALWAELARAKREGRGTIIFNWTPNFTDMEGFTMIEFPEYRHGCKLNFP